MAWMAVDSTSMPGPPNGLTSEERARKQPVPPTLRMRQGWRQRRRLFAGHHRGGPMQSHAYVAIVTLLALLTYFWMGLQVAGARRRSGIQAPAMTGDPVLERTIRAHYNTLE